MMLRRWLKNTLSDEIKDKLGEKIEDILIANKEEVVAMTSNISKTIKETFEKTREEGMEEGIEKGIEKIAVNMIKKGKNIEEIMEVTELSYEKITELKRKYQN